MAWFGRDAEFEWILDEGRSRIFDAMERRLPRRFLCRKIASMVEDGAYYPFSRACPALDQIKLPSNASKLGQELATALRRDKAILGVFDEGCMGMFNAIIPDHLLHPVGVFKERLSQSALYYESMLTSDQEANEVRGWLEKRGMKFHTGKVHEKDLTDAQIRLQCKMYVAALRIADDFGCDAIGIQYQQGLKDLMPASDLVEGTLNNSDRPPVRSRRQTDLAKGPADASFQ